MHVHRQLLPQAVHIVVVLYLALEGDDLRGVCRDARGQVTLLPGQGGDLCIVRPTEHVAGAIVDRAPVVLFVTFAAGLELAIAGDRALFAPELVHVLAAGVVEAARQFIRDPAVERRGRFDGKPVHERLRVQRRWLTRCLRPHPVIHEPRAKMRALGPCGHLGVVRLGHQE